MESVNDLCKVRRGIIGGLDQSYKNYCENRNTGEEKDKSYQHSENWVKRFGDFHVDLLSLASKRIADSTLPPSWAALLSTCIFSVSSVV